MKLTKEQMENKKFEMPLTVLQPWSTPVIKTKLPPEVLQTMIEITDNIIADENTESYGHKLAGEIDTELLINPIILEETGVMRFYLAAVRQFVMMCKCQQVPNFIEEVQKEEWLIQIMPMWVVSQYPNEYNPIHIHTECQVSSVMYLKVPEMLPSRKTHKTDQMDGSIVFTGNASRDLEFSQPQIVCPPEAGDFYIFGAHQQHAVYPYRCAEGQKETERRSVAFNALFKSRTDYNKEKASRCF